MKKNLVSLVSLALLAGLVSMTSCKKENTLGNGTQFHATMEGCTMQNGKTTLNGTALEWVSGDQIAVYGTAGCGIYTATPQNPATVAEFDNVSGETGNAPFRAFYPASLTTDGVNITLPSTQTYVDGSINEFPMYAESSNEELSFKNLCGVLKLHLTKANTSISTITITTANEINGTFSVNYNGGAPELEHVSGGTNTATLTCTIPQSIAEGKYFYIYLPEGSYTGLQIEMNTNDNRYCVKTANTAIVVNRSRYTPITLGANDLDFVEPLPQGALPGLFTINANGDQVRFSQGNLQYQASTSTWRFAEHQYDFVGGVDQYGEQFGNVYEEGVQCQNNLISSAYTGWIDLFSFGCSGWNNGSTTFAPDNTGSTYDINYFPSDGEYYDDNGQRISLTGEHAEADWAWHNPIQNGGNQAHMWRTMTEYEWDYLLFNRTASTINGVQNARFAKARVNGVAGLILFPDIYTQPSDVPAPTTYSINVAEAEAWASNSRSYNSYTIVQWSKMENNRAVFLPGSGCRGNNRNFEGIGWSGYQMDPRSTTLGYYWTSTIGDWSASAPGDGCALHFRFNALQTTGSVWVRTYPLRRWHGLAVRPVIDMN